MNIQDFKLWFQGFADSIGTGGLTASQFSIVKAKVEQLGSHAMDAPDKSGPAQPQPVPNILPDDFTKGIWDKIKENEDGWPSRKPPFGGPYDPMDPFGNGKYWLDLKPMNLSKSAEANSRTFTNFDQLIEYFEELDKLKSPYSM